MKRPVLVTAALVAATGSVLAHVDTTLRLHADGSLEGLPPRYFETRLQIDLNKRQRGDFPVVFRSRGKEFKLPACGLSAVKTRAREAVKASGSWYHEEGLPHYILLLFPDPKQPKGALQEVGVQYLLNLESPSLISIEEVVYIKPKSIEFRALSLLALCGRR